MNTTPIPTQAQYAARERSLLYAKLRDCESQPLADRRAAKADWAEAMLNVELIEQRVEWIFNGSYGWGATDRALAIREGRGNRIAALGQLLACLDWNCPPREAAAAWKALKPAQRLACDRAIARAMKSAPTVISKEDRA